MLRALSLLQRWLGVAFCPLLTKWLASHADRHRLPPGPILLFIVNI